MGSVTQTRFVRPADLGEALAWRATHPDWCVLAGGTDLMVGARHRPDPTGVIDVFGLDGLVGVSLEPDGVRIGAATTYAALLHDPIVATHLPLLHHAVREIGAVQIRERGTLGGNVITASPVGDTLPALLALDASVEVASGRGSRRLAYEDFCTGYRSTDLASDELLVAVVVPMPDPDVVQHWRKVGTRQAQAITKVALAACASVREGVVVHPRLAMGAVADHPIRLHEVEEVITGKQPGPELALHAHEAVLAAVHPIDDVRSTADYRREVAANLVARFVTNLTGSDDR
jgi:CO/xanthine dehydrogenase FAD-binding subunit